MASTGGVPRKHHYLPQFYLAAWTDDGTREGWLQVIDKLQGAGRKQRPKEVAHQRDLYMIDTDEALVGPSALEIEGFFGQVETKTAPIIARILGGGGMPEGEEREGLMLFLSTLAVRVPSFLRLMEEMMQFPARHLVRSLRG